MQLQVRNLSKRYGNGVQALDNVSLTVPPGMFGLLGPNGAGKSTLMRTLATLQSADSGTAMLGDIDILAEPDRVRSVLGYLPQDFGVYPKVTALELLDHLARLKGLVDAKARRATVDALLHRVNLHAVRKQKLGGFSGGMRQRFGIAQAMLGQPKLVIVDEPTAGLDPEERVRFHNLLADIASDVVVILSTHIVSDVADLCANFAVINRGRAAADRRSRRAGGGTRRAHLAQGRDQGGSRRAARAGRGRVDAPHGRPHRRARVRRRSRRDPASSRWRRTSRMSTSARSQGISIRRSRGPRRMQRPPRSLRSVPPEGACQSRWSVRATDMPMLTIAWFDFVRRLRMVSTYVYFVLFAVLAGLWMAAAGGALASASVNFGGDKVLVNGPYALAIGIAILGFAGITVIGSVVGRAVQQDFEYGTYHFFFSAPIAKRDYFFGRLLGAYLTLVLVFASIALGVVVGTHWPGVDSARIVASPTWQSFARPYLFLLLPNLLWLGGCFFVLAALTRQMAPVYVAGVIVLVGYLFAVDLLADMENKTLAGAARSRRASPPST